MFRFFRIHGATHEADVRDRVVPALNGRGSVCDTPDLPGNGIDRRPATEVHPARHVETLGQSVAAAPKPVILVGHSMAGIILSEPGARMLERIGALAWPAAFMLLGRHAILRFKAEPRDPSRKGARVALRMCPDGSPSTIDPSRAPALLCNTFAPEDAATAARLNPMPARPRADPIHLAPERWGRLPRHCGRTLQDAPVFPDLQERMRALAPGTDVEVLDTDHSPALCAPQAMAGWLDRIARRHERV